MYNIRRLITETEPLQLPFVLRDPHQPNRHFDLEPMTKLRQEAHTDPSALLLVTSCFHSITKGEQKKERKTGNSIGIGADSPI